jgi:D-tyrosyl-tRNA(Tyr) deacylase
MRVVIQRVKAASVTIDQQVTGAIDTGLVILAGFEDSDNTDDVIWMSGKIARLRIFNDTEGVMNCSVTEIDGSVLLISQFTLHASTKKGNRPSYTKAARPETAIPLYQAFISQLTADIGKEIQTGVFGADMKVSLINDGPVTIMIDSKNKE